MSTNYRLQGNRLQGNRLQGNRLQGNRLMGLRVLAALLVALAVSACSGILPERLPPPQLYTLTPKSTFDADMPSVDWQLAVEDFIAPAGLNTPRMAVSREPLTLDYYAGAQWVDSAPSMVRRLLIESFENSGRIVGVGQFAISLRNDYVLRPELREFQAEYVNGDGNPPTIRVRINVKMVKMPQRRIIASETFERTMEVPDNRIASIVKTFDQVLGKVFRGIVEWTLSTPSRVGS
jgi:cholesterol transport system auxiliary component